MFEKIIPVFIALIALQFLIKFINRRRLNKKSPVRDFDYKKKIDEFMKVSNFDEGVNNERILNDELRSGLGKPELMLGIPESMRDVRKGLNLIIDGVTHGIKSKISVNPVDEIKYNNPGQMFDEIIEVINKHKII